MTHLRQSVHKQYVIRRHSPCKTVPAITHICQNSRVSVHSKSQILVYQLFPDHKTVVPVTKSSVPVSYMIHIST